MNATASSYYDDPNEYWRTQGQLMTGEGWSPATSDSPEHARQETALLTLLKARNVLFPRASILEVGCGWGRLAHLFTEQGHFPNVTYHGVDIGPVQLDRARSLAPQGHFAVHDILEPLVPNPRDKRRSLHPIDAEWPTSFDLTVVSEVLMHVPPSAVSHALANLLNATSSLGYLLMIEWVPLPGELESTPTAIHNWPHSYSALVSEARNRGLCQGFTQTIRTDRQVIMLVKR